MLLVLRLLEAVHCRQRLLEIRLMPCWHRIEAVDVNFCSGGFVSVVFACKLIHLYDDLFRASHLNHLLSEGFVADVSIVDAVILFFTTFPCKLIRRTVIFASRCFSIPVTVWPVLSDVEIRDD